LWINAYDDKDNNGRTRNHYLFVISYCIFQQLRDSLRENKRKLLDKIRENFRLIKRKLTNK
ncbi:hypothetical protein NAB68_18430, partial [Proteus mirabilis]|nr:hypothetical protein [Proteus mirabilis]MCL8582696.1 hypothetical protein [Proteus mirabilis]